MPTIVIRLDPAQLDNPDLDLRYEIADLLIERTAGALGDRGYDYEPESDALLIFLSARDLDSAVPQVIAFLETEPLHRNRLADAAQVGICTDEAEDAVSFTVVYPPGAGGVIHVPS